LIDSNDKEHQHENHGQAELDPELSVVSLAQLAVGEREREIQLATVYWTCPHHPALPEHKESGDGESESKDGYANTDYG
jgi:hypothetical protein